MEIQTAFMQKADVCGRNPDVCCADSRRIGKSRWLLCGQRTYRKIQMAAARTADVSENPAGCCADSGCIGKSGRLLHGQRLERLEISVLKAAADMPEHIKVKGGART